MESLELSKLLMLLMLLLLPAQATWRATPEHTSGTDRQSSALRGGESVATLRGAVDAPRGGDMISKQANQTAAKQSTFQLLFSCPFSKELNDIDSACAKMYPIMGFFLSLILVAAIIGIHVAWRAHRARKERKREEKAELEAQRTGVRSPWGHPLVWYKAPGGKHMCNRCNKGTAKIWGSRVDKWGVCNNCHMLMVAEKLEPLVLQNANPQAGMSKPPPEQLKDAKLRLVQDRKPMDREQRDKERAKLALQREEEERVRLAREENEKQERITKKLSAPRGSQRGGGPPKASPAEEEKGKTESTEGAEMVEKVAVAETADKAAKIENTPEGQAKLPESRMSMMTEMSIVSEMSDAGSETSDRRSASASPRNLKEKVSSRWRASGQPKKAESKRPTEDIPLEFDLLLTDFIEHAEEIETFLSEKLAALAKEQDIHERYLDKNHTVLMTDAKGTKYDDLDAIEDAIEKLTDEDADSVKEFFPIHFVYTLKIPKSKKLDTSRFNRKTAKVISPNTGSGRMWRR